MKSFINSFDLTLFKVVDNDYKYVHDFLDYVT